MKLNIPVLIIGGLIATHSVGARAQNYTYSFWSPDDRGTAGVFSISQINSYGQYALTAFNGSVGGVAYNKQTAGFQNQSDGTVAIGVDTEIDGHNNFQQSKGFSPGSPSFSDTLVYSRSNWQTQSGVDVNFVDSTQSRSYTYVFGNPESTDTSGTFTFSGVPGAYSLSSFSGNIAGVSYNAGNVGFQSNSNGTVAIGVDTEYDGVNNFNQVGSFIPGNSLFSDTLVYSKAGWSTQAAVSVTFADASQPMMYTYSFAGNGQSGTSGTFSFSGLPGAYSLDSFSGTIGGVSYNAGSAGFGNNLYGRINIGLDTEIDGVNNFQEVGALLPGSLVASDTLVYSKAGWSTQAGVNVSFRSVSQVPIVLSGVPEIDSWMMMIVGLGSIGVIARRNKAVADLSVQMPHLSYSC